MQKLGDFQSAHSLSDKEIESALAHLHVTDAARAAHQYDLLAEADRRGIGKAHGYSSAAHWYAKNTRISEGSVQHLVDVGMWLSTYTTVADALAVGDIHAGHVKAIADGYTTVSQADPTLDEVALGVHVAALLEVARDSVAATVTKCARAIAQRAGADAQVRHDDERRRRAERERLRQEEEERLRREEDRRRGERGKTSTPTPPDGGGTDRKSEPEPEPGPRPPSTAENADLNTLTFFQLPDGRYRIVVNLDALTAAKMRTGLDPLTKPQPGPGGSLDPRSPSKRNADALGVIIDQHLHGRAGSSGGSAARVSLIVNLKDLLAASCSHPSNPAEAGESWPFDLDWAGPISKSLAELITCDASMNVVIVDGAGVPLAMGREERLATAAQRAAVKVRDRGCVMCGRPANWCEVHHIVYFDDGGNTDLTNLALVCGRCHRLIHNSGWELLMGEDGHPFMIPPVTTDAHRTPIPSHHRRRKPKG